LFKPQRRVTWLGVTILAFGCIAAVRAQQRDETLGAGSLAALTAEISQLRLAVEESTRNQTQTQALGVYLSAQQSRILQVANQLDRVRKDIDAASDRSQVLATQLTSFEDMLSQATEPPRRAELENRIRAVSSEQKRASLQEQQARNREAEISQALQLENARWSDLISRLEQLIKR
jgi:chromosome segregation ATPase